MMKTDENLQVHGSSRTRSALRNAVEIVLIGTAALLISMLLLWAFIAMAPNPCSSDDAIDMYGCQPDGTM